MTDGEDWTDDSILLIREIEQGVAQARQAHYADAAAHLALARDQCRNSQDDLRAALTAFLATHTRFWNAQQELHQASVRFVKADAEQLEHLAALQRLLDTPSSPAPTLPSASSAPWGAVEGRRRDSPTGTLLAATPHQAHAQSPLPPLTITCFGRFEVRREGLPLDLCRNRNGQAVLRYLVAHPRRRQTMDALMEALWPDETPDAARHKLHVATSALRCALNGDYACPKGTGYLVCDNGYYALNPAVLIESDADAFEAHYQAGQRAGGSAAVPHYEAACRLYRGPFLVEDLYADWSLIRREQLTAMYVTMCTALTAHALAVGRHDDATTWATLLLAENRCDEVAYRQLMRAYAAAGRRAEALRHYQRCERVLADELGVQPAAATTALFYALLRGEPLPEEDAHSGA